LTPAANNFVSGSTPGELPNHSLPLLTQNVCTPLTPSTAQLRKPLVSMEHFVLLAGMKGTKAGPTMYKGEM
jgi:hypothetical protein